MILTVMKYTKKYPNYNCVEDYFANHSRYNP